MTLAALSFSILLTFWFIAVRPYYAPWGDEFSLIVNSTHRFHPAIRSWFTEGFSNYFVPYPTLFSGGLDFIRPGVNFVYYINSLLFDAHWACYLIANYLFHSLAVGMTAFLAQKYMRLSTPAILACSFLTFLSPAFDIQVLLLPSFAFDMLAAVIVLAALISLLDGHLGLSWGLLLIGSFTKEVTWFAPLAAGLVVFLIRPSSLLRQRLSISFIFPAALLPAWTLRTFIFHGRIHAYTLSTLNSPAAILKSILRGLLKWPSMPLSLPEVGFGTFWRPGWVGHWYSYTSLAVGAGLSVAFWILVTPVFFDTFKGPSERFSDILLRRNRIILVFLCGSLALPVFGCLSVRFGALAYSLLFLYLLTILDKNRECSMQTVASALILFFIGASSIFQKLEILRTQLPKYHYLWNMSASYVKAIHDTRVGHIITINDVSGVSSSPKSVSIFSGYNGLLIRVNDLDLTPRNTNTPKLLRHCDTSFSCSYSMHVDRLEGEFQLRNSAPSLLSATGTLLRADQGFQFNYHFGDIRAGAIAGQDLEVTIENAIDLYDVILPGTSESYVRLPSTRK